MRPLTDFDVKFRQQRRHHRRSELGCFAIFCVLFVLPSVLIVWTSANFWLQDHAWRDFANVLFGALATAVFCKILHSWATGPLMVRMLPYFPESEGPMVEADFWLKGRALTLYGGALDRLAAQREVLPLSHFGFNDDRNGEELIWHSAELGVQTVHTLLEAVPGHPLLGANTADLEADLTALDHTLSLAQEHGVPFSLILRFGTATCQQEMDVRQGSFFSIRGHQPWQPRPRAPAAATGRS